MDISKENLYLKIIKEFLGDRAILLVDDEEEIRSLMFNYLTRIDIKKDRIIFSSNGKEALSKILNQDFGLIIVDILMPKMNGLQLIKEIKQRAKSKDIPVLIISGAIDAENIKTAITYGISNVIVKPFNYNIFLEKIERTLGLVH